MAVASPQQAPVYRFGNDEHENLSLFNCSPLGTSPRPSVARLTGVYYASTFSKNRRSRKLLERRDKLQKNMVQRQEDAVCRRSAHQRMTSPYQTMSQPHTPKPPPSPDKAWRSTSGDVTDRRRQEFMVKRKALIQNQIKRQLAIPIIEPNKKLKTSSNETPDIDVQAESTSPNDDTVFRASPEKLASVDENAIADPSPSPMNLDPLAPPQRPSLTQRRKSLIRTSSHALRSANAITRRAVNIIGQALEKKRDKKKHRLKSAKEIQEDRKNLVRKYSMLWMSKTVERKRMSSCTADSEDIDNLTVSKLSVRVRETPRASMV